MFFFKTSILLLFFICLPVAAVDKHGWKLVKQQNDITVYTRKVANSSYKEFRGELNINANMDELLAFVLAAKDCSSWRYKCITMLNLSDDYIYKLSHLPWPFSHRYTVMKSQLSFDKKNSYTLKLSNIKRFLLPKKIQHQLPEPGNTKQMRYSDGYWQFKFSPLDNNIHITYQMHGDAGIAVPSELTQLGIINSAFITLNNLKKHFAVQPSVLYSEQRKAN